MLDSINFIRLVPVINVFQCKLECSLHILVFLTFDYEYLLQYIEKYFSRSFVKFKDIW